MIVGVLVAAATPIISSASATPANIAGMVVFIDPGHNGANDASIGRQVPTGRGGTKNCQASGTSTNSGYPEHTFTWETGLRLRAALNALGVRTALSRGNDNALGPCVDERANMANALRPNAIVSLHADGGPASGRGFHVNYSAPPLNAIQAGPSVQFARIMRDQLQASGIPKANYIGQDGLYGRSDLAGLNLAQYPSILVELGRQIRQRPGSRRRRLPGHPGPGALAPHTGGTPTAPASSSGVTLEFGLEVGQHLGLDLLQP